MNFLRLTQTLHVIQKELGSDTLRYHQRVIGALKDYMPDGGFEHNMANLFYMSGAAELLFAVSEDEVEQNIAINQVRVTLVRNWGMNTENADDLVNAFATVIYDREITCSAEDDRPPVFDIFSFCEESEKSAEPMVENEQETPKLTPTDFAYFDFCSNDDGTCIIMGSDALYQNQLTELVIPERSPEGELVMEIMSMGSCASLKQLYIPEGVTRICQSAFVSLHELEELYIPKSVGEIEEGAFMNCRKLCQITVHPENPCYQSYENCLVDTQGKVLVLGCSTSMIPAEGQVKSIAPYAFSGCVEMTELVIPEGIHTVNTSAFYMCESLSSVYMSKTVALVRNRAFDQCKSLKAINVDAQNPTYHSERNCLIHTASKKLTLGCCQSRIPDDGSVLTIGMDAFYGCGGLEKIVLPSCIQKIDHHAFASTDLKCIRIPKDTVSIENTAFLHCEMLETLEVNSQNQVYHSNCNCLVHTASKTLLLGTHNASIPGDGSVTTLGDHALAYGKTLTEIVIPYYVTKLGAGCFSGCTELMSVTLLQSLEEISDEAFYGCEGIFQITIPKSVKRLGKRVFGGCKKLAHIYYRGTQGEWASIRKSDNLGAKGCRVHCSDGVLLL